MGPSLREFLTAQQENKPLRFFLTEGRPVEVIVSEIIGGRNPTPILNFWGIIGGKKFLISYSVNSRFGFIKKNR